MDGSAVAFRVRAPSATRVEVWLYASPTDEAPLARHVMPGPVDGLYKLTLARTALGAFSAATIFYGYRAWGPNWPYDAEWTPGSSTGFIADVDAYGHRFNPNKLLLDPYAREVSHCVQTPARPDRSAYLSGPAHRTVDTGPFAPKGIVLPDLPPAGAARPTHPFKDDIIYEVHVRGLTMADPTIPPALRGTFAGAALRAPYLRDLGVTAVEFLPVQQTQNALNDDPAFAADHNYWGYQTMAYFAPDRRLAADRSPGGPTREWVAMVDAFHAVGLKVFIDVVFNHHEEGDVDAATGLVGTIYSLRGLDNPGYYEIRRDGRDARFYENDNGVGPNLNAANPQVRDLVVDCLCHWTHALGVDGFRFDLGAVLGNTRRDGGFLFDRDDPDNILNLLIARLPLRPLAGGAGVDLVAEPYAASMDGQEQGNFPAGWAEWNDRFRDTIRAAQNKLGIIPVSPAMLATRFAGSQDLFGAAGRRPSASVNYVVCHDGFTLYDLHTRNDRDNARPFPYGPSDGGRGAGEEMCWDQGGDPVRQAQAIRTSLALLLLSAGVPMLTGGTEFDRTQHGNNNAYNLDTAANWLDWSRATTAAEQSVFVRRLLAFRAAHPALRPADFFKGAAGDGRAIRDITWLRADGGEADETYLAESSNHFIAYQLDGAIAGDAAARILVAYNGWIAPIRFPLPALSSGEAWCLAIDTAAAAASWRHAREVGTETIVPTGDLEVAGRACVALVARRSTGSDPAHGIG